MNIKQLFCKHIYKITKVEEVGTTSSKVYMTYLYGRVWTLNYKNTAVYKTCLKCGKEIIIDGLKEV